ncbi:unnamed protein product [Caenorhabditis auriculariae]|uniref:D-3-phosphoglycerate dehydrogenase n=1 Tax=Caenorhabditis auriculariae TaxID=2777116 RepID=A0A8S1HMZ8_9PELO|nr:unnamed protein product [Caenorhabditis auriculariae]
MTKISSVLIADDIEQECVDILQNAGIQVSIKTKQTKEQLLESLPQHDAVIVRSATKITSELLDAAAGKLKLVGRAGTGVDNIDVPAATRNNVLVMNTPQANSRSAAELTCSLVMALARHVPQAAASMKEGKWARKDYMGEEVFGRTLAVLGLGRIGTEVAFRMQAFGMRVIGFDPVVSKEQAAARNIELLSLEEIWPQADYVTVHVPLIKQTENLINKESLAKCKKGVRVINVARGGIVNEADLVEALDSGHVAGAAIDVFEQEPPAFRELVDHPRAICIPHLGASTIDAQLRVASEIAENIVQLNQGTVLGVLNANEVLR